MSKRKRRRPQGPPADAPTPGTPGRTTRLIALVCTAALVAAGIAAASIAALAGSAPAKSAAAAVPPQAVEKAAEAAGFRPSAQPGADMIERMPVDSPLAAPSPGLLPPGSLAPDWTLSTPLGEQVRLSDYRGRTVLLEFFATWCPHCQAEAKHLVALHARLPSAKFAFLAITADGESAPEVLAYERYFGIKYPALLDPGPAGAGSGAGRVTRQYKVVVFPTFYIIDPAGKIAWRSDHEQPDALLEQELMRASGR